MSKSGIAALAACTIAALLLDHSVTAAAPGGAAGAQTRHLRAGWFAQAPAPIRKRPRAQIIVRPRGPDTGIYPSPLPYAWPGPNAVRDCDSRLVVENRPSGTVLFPRMHCWWTTQ